MITMRGFSVLVALFIILGPATRVYGWRSDHRYWREVEDEMRRIATVQKSEQTKATAVRKGSTIDQPPPAQQVRQRLALIHRQLIKVEGDRKKAVEKGRPAGDVAALDERIEKLKTEAAEWQKLLGLAAP